MNWKISYLPEYQIVMIKTLGSIPYQELSTQFLEAARLARASNTHCYLFDDTELHIDVSTIDIYDIPKLLTAAGVKKVSRIAILVSTQESGVEDYHFLETVCVNQGLNVKMFFSLDEALSWLKAE